MNLEENNEFPVVDMLVIHAFFETVALLTKG